MSPTGGGGLLRWNGGAGWLIGQKRDAPAVYRSLGDLMVYFAITGQTYGWPGTPYSLNGVSPDLAVCVEITDLKNTAVGSRWLLYVAPDMAYLAWNYILNWLNTAPGAANCPVMSAPKSAKYVGIANDGAQAMQEFNCTPDMSKLTRL